MNRFPRRRGLSYRHLGRYGEILSVLVKYGFGDVVASLNVEKYAAVGRRLIRVKARKHPPAETLTRGDRVRLALEELGPTFIKLGQFMSNRPDVLPQEYIVALEKLQDSVKPFPGIEAKNIVERELKKPVGELFISFYEQPFACASIAQVHVAVLPGGQKVAVKVRRPRIEHQVTVDLEILHHLATLAERHFTDLRTLSPVHLVEEFERALRKELDLAVEASHINHFARIFHGDTSVYVPKVYVAMTTHRVLTTEFIEGTKVSDLKGLRRAGHDTSRIAAQGAVLVLKQIFDHGFFHADPHPGNILIRADGSICFIDFGSVGILSPSLRDYVGMMVYSLANRDSRSIVKMLAQFARQPVQDLEYLEYEVAELLEEMLFLSLKEIDIGGILGRIVTIISEHNLRIVPGFYLLLKALITIEGVGYRLDPDFALMEHLEPFARRVIRERLGPRRLLYDASSTALDVGSLLRDFPSELKEIMRILKSGKTTIQFEHRGLEPMLMKHDQLVNRLIFAIVLAALVVGSSLVVLSGVPPTFYGMPVVGLAGFVTAGIIGFGLLFSIIRHRRF